MDDAPAPTAEAEPSDLDLIRHYLSHRSVGCPMCRYELHGLTSDRCPECGERLVLRLFPAEPKMKIWLAGLIALAGGTGFHAIVFVWGIVVNMFSAYPPTWRSVLVLSVGGIVDGVLLALWLAAGKGVRRLGVGKRVALVVGAWLVVGAIATASFSLTTP